MKEQVRVTFVALPLLTLILGIAYPLFMCGVGKALFPGHASGGLIRNSTGQVIGSKYIGQNFTKPQYFHPRPSLAGAKGYDPMSSGGSNLGPTSKKLIEQLRERITAYRLENNLPPNTPIPSDAVCASASGLDPHISVANAHLQALRVAAARNVPLSTIEKAIDKASLPPWLGLFGDSRVNVLQLNLLLDGQISQEGQVVGWKLPIKGIR